MYEHYQLSNKANIYLVPIDNTKSLTGLVLFPVGSRFESEKMNGSSHFIEHLMFKGTKKRPNTLALTREIDRLGAEYNAFTNKEMTGYYVKADAGYAETVLDILSDMLYNSLFDAKEMEREKTVVVEELKMYRDNPLMNIGNLFEELMFAGCPLGWDIGGTPRHVLAYNRDEVLRYRDRHYDPSNMTVVVAGSINEKVKDLLARYFGQEKSRFKASKVFKPAVFGSSSQQDRLLVDEKKTDQAQLMLGFPGFNHTDKRNATLAVLDTILGGSMSSRLFIQVRERRGLAYMIKSGADSFRDTGYVYVRAGLDAKNLNRAIAVIKKEIEKVIDKGISQRELADAKTHIRGGLSLALENSNHQADWYGHQALFMDKIHSPEERLREIDKVTADGVKRLAEKVFDFNQMRVAIIGDLKKEAVVF